MELEDINGGKADFIKTIFPDGLWHKIAVGLDEFQGNFNATVAKFLGLTFADYPNNTLESGVLYVDDFYWVEQEFQKPQFGELEDLIAYVNEVSFRHFWQAVDSRSKFAWDRHIWDDLISVDAIGFQLSSYIIAHQNGWIAKDKLEERVEHILHYLLHVCEHATDVDQVIAEPLRYATIKGNWAHFLDAETLGRKNSTTEFSIFSNCLLLSAVHAIDDIFPSQE